MNARFKVLLFFISSAVIGTINGLLGGGGGMLCVPVLKSLLNLEDKVAHATTILIMAIISIPTLIIYITNFEFKLLPTLFVSFGVLIGGILGSKLLKNLKNDVINLIFIILMFFAGLKMIF